MNRIETITETTRGGTCAICFMDFKPGEIGYTHTGGENHDGFHKKCYAKWFLNHTICPYNDAKVDPSALISRTERIMAHLEPVREIAAYATGLGFTAVVAAAAIVPAVADAAVIDPETIILEIISTAFFAGMIVALDDEIAERKMLAVMVVMACLLAALGGMAEYPIVGFILGPCVGFGAKKILDIRGVDTRQRILIPMWLASEGLLCGGLMLSVGGKDIARRILRPLLKVAMTAMSVLGFYTVVLEANAQELPGRNGD